ncbi:MAG: hypothetical protein ACP5T0_02155 [Verrucomicrobiia bacterium]
MNLSVKENKRFKELRFSIYFLLLILSGFDQSQGAEVLTVNLEYLKGEAHLTSNGVLLDVNGNKRKFALNELLDIAFNTTGFNQSVKLIFPQQTEKPFETLPPGWKDQDIGNPKQRGSAKLNIESRQPIVYSFSIKGAGAGAGNSGDTLHFLYTQTDSDFDLLAKITSFYGSDNGGSAGIMIRNNTDFNSDSISLGVTPKNEAIFLRRLNRGIPEKKTAARYNIPCWIRIKREGELVRGFVSADGCKWNELESYSYPIKGKANVGFYVYSGKDNSIAQARLSNVLLLYTESNFIHSFVVLKDGSKVAAQIIGLDKNKVNFSINGKEFSTPVKEIARVLFSPVPFELETKLINKPTGIMFANGEYLECEITGLRPDIIEIKIRDGSQQFKLKQDVIAAVFNVSKYEPSEYEIYDMEGSVIFSKNVILKENKITVSTGSLEDIEIPESSLIMIRRAGGIARPGELSEQYGNVATLETGGRKITGKIEIGGNKIAIKKEDGLIETVELKEIKRLIFPEGESDESQNQIQTMVNLTGTDIGINQFRGRYSIKKDSIWIEGAAPIQDQQLLFDSYYFLNSPVEGDFEMVTRLTGLENRNGFAGILVIDKLDKFANGILLALRQNMGFFVRKYEDRTGNVTKLDLKPPVWFKAERTRRRLSAYVSKDGKNWTGVFHYEKEIPPRIFAGLAINSGEYLKSARAFFDNLEIKGIKAKPFKNRLVLTSGSEICCDIISADDSAFHVYTSFDPELIITTKNICYAIFDGSTVSRSAIPENRGGVLFPNNDFLEADFKSIEGDNLAVSSVILGIRYYKLGETAKALVFKTKKVVQPGFQITVNDGSKLFCKNINFRNGKIIVAEELATENQFEIPLNRVLSIEKVFAN